MAPVIRIALFCLMAGLCAADDSLEYRVRAAFLLNFTKFVEWPASSFADAGAPMTICILGEDPFGRVLDQLTAGESVDSRIVVVHRLKRAPEPKSCQVLYVSKPEKETGKILASLGPGVLTVGEGGEFVRDGGMIAFVLDNRRVRFDISQAVADGAGLKLSSKLLSIARSPEK